MRQQHARLLVAGLQSSSLGRLLWLDWPAQDAPYMVPFLLNEPAGFDLLRKRGVQVLRWEELAWSECNICQSYRARLIQLPCHQEMDPAELQQLISVMQ